MLCIPCTFRNILESFEKHQLFILVFLGLLTAFGPFVTDMYLPPCHDRIFSYNLFTGAVRVNCQHDRTGHRPTVLRSVERQIWTPTSFNRGHGSLPSVYSGMHLFSNHHAVCGLKTDTRNGRCGRHCHLTLHCSR